jgi:uncharacterized protein YrzB (UPF0473 family)
MGGSWSRGAGFSRAKGRAGLFPERGAATPARGDRMSTQAPDSAPEMEDDPNEGLIVLSGADGTERSFQSLAMVEVEGKRYAVLAPAEANLDEESDEEIELYLFEHEVDDEGDEIFSEIEDEQTWNKVQAAAEAMLLEGEEDDGA